MSVIKNRSWWVGVIYFPILLCFGLLMRDTPRQPVAFDITHQNFTETTGMSDPASFATAAVEIAENGWVSSDNGWILSFWPPGFILLEASLLKLLGAEAPIILILQVLAAILFSIVLVLLYDFLKTSMQNQIAFVLPLLIFAFPVSRVFLLQPVGIVLGETFSIGFFLLFILLAFRSSLGQLPKRNAAAAGFFLALSAYFRSQFEIIILMLTVWGILLALAINFSHLRGFLQFKLARSIAKTIAVALLVAHTSMIPWRVYHWIHQGSPLWVQTSSITFGNAVTTSKYLEDIHAGFVVEGGGNLVCRIDPSTCGDTANAKRLFIRTFITHPMEWYSLKFEAIGRYWFSSMKDWSGVVHKSTTMEVVLSGLFLFALIAVLVLLFVRKLRCHPLWLFMLWLNISLFSAYWLIFTVQHFETRYFYFPKIIGVVMVLIVTSLYFQPMKKIDIKTNLALQ